jgi:hypothetical protein
MIAAGLYKFADLQTAFSDGTVSTFSDFLSIIDSQMNRIVSLDLRAIHREVKENFQKGDPTPFKSFRREEYLTTTGRMGTDSDGEDLDALLKDRITINSEVAQILSYFKRRGVLILGLSDKPDEAVFPTPLLAGQGRKPLHHVETLVVGEILDLSPLNG